MLYQQVSQRAVIDIRTGDDASCPERLLVPAAVHDQRSPSGDLGSILAIFNSVVAVAGGHRLEPLAREPDIVLPPPQRHRRDGEAESGGGAAWAKADVARARTSLIAELPAVPPSCGVLGKEDVAGVQEQVVARARLEVERAA